MDKNKQVSLRIPKKDYKTIKHLIAEECYLNVGDFLRASIRTELSK